MRLKALAVLAIFPLTAIALSPARAAPQILGLIASAEPVPMTCAGGTCTAELSSVCLQQHRATPSNGTVYRSAKRTRITLSVMGSDGVNHRQQIETKLSFVSLRQYTAVKVSLSEATVRQLGDGTASLSVDPMASLIPVAVEGDALPLSVGEIDRYTGLLRAAAERAFQRDSDRVNATLILNQMVNRLPRDSQAGVEEAVALWKRMARKDATVETRKLIKRAFEDCRETMRIGVQPDLRSCLAYQHDYLAGENTNTAWQAMNPGS